MPDKTARKHIAGRNLVLFNELSKVLRHFSAHAVPVIVLKGAALANSVYGSISDRPMNDVDLLVRNEDLERALSVLETTGYQIEPLPQEKFHPFNKNFTGEINFIGKSGVVFDLHWELTCNEWIRKIIRLDAEELWRSAQPLAINGDRGLQLSPVYTLLHVCLHLMGNAYSHRVAYRDIANLINFYKPFPWEEFLTQVVRSRLCTSCYIVLDIVSKEFAVEIPGYVFDAIRPHPWKKWLIYRISDPVEGLRGRSISDNTAFLVQLISADRLWDVVRVLLWLFMPGPKWLEERYGLSSMPEAWLACLWHPLVVLSRGLMGVWEVVKRNGWSHLK
jgi:hypothetical protein